MTRRRLAGRAGILLLLVHPASATAQQADTTVTPVVQPPPLAPDTLIVPRGPSPGGAFLRSLVVPGWGQGAVGSYVRGGIYFGGHLGNTFMLLKTRSRLSDVRQRVDRRAAFVTQQILLERPGLIAFPDSLAARVAADERVSELRGLESAREQQQEDWLVWSGFWLLANAVDAYVAAQLADFPAEVLAEPLEDRGVKLQVRVPVGRP